MTGRAFASPHRTPARLCDCVMTLRRPGLPSALLACGRFGSGLPPWTHHPFCASSGDIVTRSPAPRRPRPRPPCRTEAIGRLGHYGQTRHDRPDPVLRGGSGTSPEVWSPTAHTSRVARLSGSSRPPDDPASAFRSSTARARWRTTVGGARPCGFTLFGSIVVARLDPADVRGGSCGHHRAAHGRRPNHRADATPVVFRSVARVRSVKPSSHAS